jgi:protein-tyrosine phosphatase
MIDIHCHPLPGVDDGAKTLEIAVSMCRMAAADGITHLVATPHSNYKYHYDREANVAKLAELQAAVGSDLQLLLGCDFNLSFDNIQRLSESGRNYTVNGTTYLLVEFADFFNPEQMDNVFYEIEVSGLTPILTHPERNPVFQRKPDLLYRWVSRGCLAQITAKSMTGGFGSKAQRLSEQWLSQNLIHFFATDAHDLDYRPPVLSTCYQRVAELKGRELADLLLKQNPRAVIEGQPLPPGPSPIEPSKPRALKGWFSFLRHKS